MTRIEQINSVVRPLVTLMLTIVLCWGFIANKVSGETFINIVLMVVTFWFSQRQTVKDSAPPNGGKP